MNRLVLDTNVLVSSFLSSGPPRHVVTRVRDGLDLLCFSPPILAEYIEVLSCGGVPAVQILALIELLRDPERALIVAPAAALHAIRDDPEDDKFLECAVAAQANVIVSGDRHLRRLRAFRGIEILSPREYLEHLE